MTTPPSRIVSTLPALTVSLPPAHRPSILPSVPVPVSWGLWDQTQAAGGSYHWLPYLALYSELYEVKSILSEMWFATIFKFFTFIPELNILPLAVSENCIYCIFYHKIHIISFLVLFYCVIWIKKHNIWPFLCHNFNLFYSTQLYKFYSNVSVL